MKTRKLFRTIYGFSISLILITNCSGNYTKSIPEIDSFTVNNLKYDDHLFLGLPTDNDSTDDFIIKRTQYVLSYNNKRNVSNWVMWRLNSSWYGDVKRYSGNFITDNSLPAAFYRVKHSDYTNSGFDRGHLVRSEERTNSVKNNRATFILTNIYPQTPDLNRGVWLAFERYCEKLCKDDRKELLIIAGGIFKNYHAIRNKIAIPDSCFKIAVVLNKNGNDLMLNQKSKVVSVVMPNIEGIRNSSWLNFTTTIRHIENSTNYNFLSKLPPQLQDYLENISNN